MEILYPNPRRDESISDTYLNKVEVKDPYRWMEDPDSEETKKFVDEQNAITRPFLDKCPFRADINTRLTELWNYPKYSCPRQHGDKFFFYKNTGLQNQSVLYVQDSLTAEPKVFIDPNTLSDDGTVALQVTAFSEDEQIFSYGLSSCGSDWISVHFKHVEKGDIYPEQLNKVKLTELSWTHDNKGIFYGCYLDQEGKTDGSETETNKNQKLYYHRVGTPQSEDVLVVEFPEEPNFIIGSGVSDCGRYLIVTPQKGCQDNLVYISDLETVKYEISGKLDLIPIITKIEADYEFIANNGTSFIFRTNKNAPNYKLIIIDVENPAPESWQTLIPESEKDVLEWAEAVYDNYLAICYIQDVKSVLQLHDLKTGKLIKKFPLETGTITGFSGDRKYKDIFFQFASFLTPGIIYHCDLSNPQFDVEIFREIEVEKFDREKFTTEQVFYQSKDGTRVPMFIIYKKGLQKDGNNPCYLYGYGGFNISLLPSFSVTRLVFIDNFDGVVAVPNIRGGGEYGEKWHRGGRLENKQNVFDDFQSAAEYLIQEKYTCNKLLTINGGSNGGLLVAACANQRPDLFGCAVANVGVLDMLRFHKFTIGYLWVSDYGSAENEKDFEYLYKYSPLHNIRIPDDPNIQYPATLLSTADHDDRVVPLHSLKFIATLQHTFRNHPYQKNPLLIRIEKKAGHGGGKPTAKIIEEITDIMCFIVNTTGIKFHL